MSIEDTERVAGQVFAIQAKQTRRKYANPECPRCTLPRELNPDGKYICKPCKKLYEQERKIGGSRQRRKSCEIGTHKHAPEFRREPTVIKPLWQPSWAAQSRPEIIQAVRDARAAQRRLRG